MVYNYMTFILLFSFITQSFCLNVLFISFGLAGHVTPIFELSKAMKNHNITFLTQQLTQSYIDLKSYSSPSFRVIYGNDSSDAWSDEKNREQQLAFFLSNGSLFNRALDIQSIMGQTSLSILSKTIHILMNEKFDVIVASSMIIGIPVLCKETNTPCVLQTPMTLPSIIDFNIPNVFSLLSTNDLTQLGYRIYNLVFTIRILSKIVPKLVLIAYKFLDYVPQIPGPFYDIFTLRNFLSAKSKCLNLISMPPSFFTPSYSHYSTKYLGPYIDETLDNNLDNNLTRWIISKPFNSIIYGTFGSLTLIPYERMHNLINGLGIFLLQVNDSSLLLAFSNTNYITYQTVLKNFDNKELKNVLNDNRRVRIENGFVNQKWILRHHSVKIFLSHCGMGSTLESLYFAKPILCMPFSVEQFINSITIKNLHIGQSLFVPPSLWQSLINPYDFHDYTFTSNSVVEKLLTIWIAKSYENVARLMSLEMKHAGGLKRAVEEIEFFVNLQGNYDRFAPFESTLPFYQRYMLDLLFIFIILPGIILIYTISKCYKRRRKEKND